MSFFLCPAINGTGSDGVTGSVRDTGLVCGSADVAVRAGAAFRDLKHVVWWFWAVGCWLAVVCAGGGVFCCASAAGK